MLSVLEDLIPAKYRKYVVYILIPLAVVVYGVWRATNGDWEAFWPALFPALIGWLVAAPNTHPGDSLPVPPFDQTDQPDADDPAIQPTPAEIDAATANAEGTYADSDVDEEDL